MQFYHPNTLANLVFISSESLSFIFYHISVLFAPTLPNLSAIAQMQVTIFSRALSFNHPNELKKLHELRNVIGPCGDLIYEMGNLMSNSFFLLGVTAYPRLFFHDHV